MLCPVYNHSVCLHWECVGMHDRIYQSACIFIHYVCRVLKMCMRAWSIKLLFCSTRLNYFPQEKSWHNYFTFHLLLNAFTSVCDSFVCVCARAHARVCMSKTGRDDEIARSSTNKFTMMQGYCRWVYWTNSLFLWPFVCVCNRLKKVMGWQGVPQKNLLPPRAGWITRYMRVFLLTNSMSISIIVSTNSMRTCVCTGFSVNWGPLFRVCACIFVYFVHACRYVCDFVAHSVAPRVYVTGMHMWMYVCIYHLPTYQSIYRSISLSIDLSVHACLCVVCA